MATGEVVGLSVQGLSLIGLLIVLHHARRWQRTVVKRLIAVGIFASAVGCALVWVY